MCEARDTKSLYAKARRGEIKDFTGINSPYEVPLNAELCLNTAKVDLEECINRLVQILVDKVCFAVVSTVLKSIVFRALISAFLILSVLVVPELLSRHCINRTYARDSDAHCRILCAKLNTRCQ